MDKLTSSLRNLAPSEFKRFSKYIHSPYFCQHLDTQRLLEVIAAKYPDFSFDLFESYKKCYPGKLNKTKFNLIKSYLHAHLNDFRAIEAFRNNKADHEIQLIDTLRENGEYKEAEKKVAFLEKKMDTHTWNDSVFEQHYQINALKFDLQLHTHMNVDRNTLEHLFDSLDAVYFLRLLKYNLSEHTFSRVLGTPVTGKGKSRNSRINAMEVETFHPLIQIYFHLNDAISNNNPETAKKAEKLLEQFWESIDIVERINAYGYLQNFWTRQYSKGGEGAIENLFRIYQGMAGQDLVFGRGDISGHLIRNLTLIACRTGNQEWTKSYFQANQTAIERDLGMNVYSFSTAYIHFSEGNFPLALRDLQSLEFKDQFYRTGHQVLLLRIYYEMHDFETLDALSNTFRRYLNRAKGMSETVKDLNRNFLSILKMLALVKERGKGARGKLEKISETLKEKKEITDRTWLAEKLKELEGQA